MVNVGKYTVHWVFGQDIPGVLPDCFSPLRSLNHFPTSTQYTSKVQGATLTLAPTWSSLGWANWYVWEKLFRKDTPKRFNLVLRIWWSREKDRSIKHHQIMTATIQGPQNAPKVSQFSCVFFDFSVWKEPDDIFIASAPSWSSIKS